MRDTIDFGIDLGTTNSAIAVAGNGTVTVIKNNEGWDVTPSAVWLPKPDRVYVGRPAREHAEDDPENAAAEFKLEMGLADARKTFPRAHVTLTPQQLSAEVLKSLRADAAHHCGGPPPDAAVITVPAAFALNQNKATTEAAALAGFGPACPLVQEPTAAAFAYGFQEASDRAYWMVFDFGGGTFDAAVVSKRDGDLRVLNHAGDPYLGGKLIDWAVVERVLAPAAGRDLGLRDLRRDEPKWRANFAKLKAAAEEAKIHLSRRDRVDITTTLAAADGTPETFEYTLRRGELDALAEPFYVRAINLCREALRDAGLGPGDIDRLLLVGGATLAPGLRERLMDARDGLGIVLDVSLDPTTVVARGAALYASTIRRPRTSHTPLAQGEFAVELVYEPSVGTLRPTVAGRVRGPSHMDWTAYSVTLSNPGGQPPFRSGRVPLNAKGAFATEVEVDSHRTSRFTVELTDATGAPCRITPDTLSITHRDVEFDGVKLTQSLGIQLDGHVFAPVVPKGAGLPTTVRRTFPTTATLSRSDTDAVICIPVVQGERSRADRNRTVGTLEIWPRDVRIDVPAGTEVEVSFEVDQSGLVTVVADVPLLDAQFEAEINLDNVRSMPPRELAELLDEAEGRLAALRSSASAVGSPEADRRLARLDQEKVVDTAREQVRAATVDVGAAATAEDRLRDFQAELDDIADAVLLPDLLRELGTMLDQADGLVRHAGHSGDRQELAGLRRRAQEASAAQDSGAVRALVERTGRFLVELERRGPDWPVKLFHTLTETLGDSGQAAPLVREGRQALASDDPRALDSVNQRLFRLLPRDEQNKVIYLGGRP
jgi:molecular chaperone DnaK